MDIIDLSNISVIDSSSATSKGNQLKWFVDGKWYKSDYMGYEGLCEAVTSELLKKSNIADFVSYRPVKIQFDGETRNGCVCDNFRKKDESIITLERLSRSWLSCSFAEKLTEYHDVKDKIKRTVDFISSVTKLENVGEYLTVMLEIDAFFLNEDRHTNNIAFILDDKSGKYKYCPYFDLGLSLLADTTSDYPMGADIYKLISSVKAKPFDRDFDVQLDAVQELYGDKLRFSFTNADIEKTVDMLEEFYDEKIRDRVKEILYIQKNKYLYMFR